MTNTIFGKTAIDALAATDVLGVDDASDSNITKKVSATQIATFVLAGTAANVTTNANLTGAVTSIGNATSLGSFTAAALSTAVSDDNAAFVGLANAYTVQQNFVQATLTSTANSIAWNASTGQTATHTATESTTLANPTNMVAGATYQFTWVQHASSAKTLAFGNAYVFSGSSTVSATVSTVAIFTFTSDGSKMRGVMTQFAS